MRMLTISQLNRYVKAVLEEDKKLGSLFLTGEISNFTHHYASGHFYFSLGDGQASVRAVMFKRYAGELAFLPEDGMEVVAHASVSLYERDGSFQVYVTDLVPGGEGATAVGLRQRKERLAKLGVFDPAHKKPLPPFPETIGVITSETGAAIGDILRVLESRCPIVRVRFAPAQVQGIDAPRSLIQSLQLLDGRCDCIILGRGGGSSEDLSAFQDEELAMQIFRTVTPVISAVGHEVDTTICDLAADLRAPTPSIAAEMAVPSAHEIARRLDDRSRKLTLLADRMLQEYEQRLTIASRSRVLKNPSGFIKTQEERLSFLWKSLYNRKEIFFEAERAELSRNIAMLESLSPLAVLARGYGIVRSREKTVTSVSQLLPGDSLQIRLRDGVMDATLDRIVEGMEP